VSETCVTDTQIALWRDVSLLRAGVQYMDPESATWGGFSSRSGWPWSLRSSWSFTYCRAS